MVVSPAARAVKNPPPSTVPTVVFELDHAKTTSGITLLYRSYAVAVNCLVSPTLSSAVGGDAVIVVRTDGVAVTVQIQTCISDPFALLAAAETFQTPTAALTFV